MSRRHRPAAVLPALALALALALTACGIDDGVGVRDVGADGPSSVPSVVPEDD